MEAVLVAFAFVSGIVVGATAIVLLMSSAIRGQQPKSEFPAATQYERKRAAELKAASRPFSPWRG